MLEDWPEDRSLPLCRGVKSIDLSYQGTLRRQKIDMIDR